jgi:hypothetical protein
MGGGVFLVALAIFIFAGGVMIFTSHFRWV